jgi:hypothetical protein
LLDTDVVITGWMDARIRWPLCRPLAQHRLFPSDGGGLLILGPRRAILRNGTAEADPDATSARKWYSNTLVDVFTRRLSIAHLQQRLRSLDGAGAYREEVEQVQAQLSRYNGPLVSPTPLLLTPPVDGFAERVRFAVEVLGDPLMFFREPPEDVPFVELMDVRRRLVDPAADEDDFREGKTARTDDKTTVRTLHLGGRPAGSALTRGTICAARWGRSCGRSSAPPGSGSSRG